MTPLLTRLQQAFDASTDPAERAELLAERACYLARIGQLAEAQEIAASLRRTYGDGRNARVSVWIMLAEGLVLFFDRVNTAAARDRVIRANLISTATGFDRVQWLSSAWLAHIDFERGDYKLFPHLLSAGLSSGKKGLNDVQCRAGLVMGDAYQYLGMSQRADYWYKSCHSCAVREGDQATLGAIMYNRAAFASAALRVQYHLTGRSTDIAKLHLLKLEIDSAWNYQLRTGVTALPHLVKLCQLEVLILSERWHELVEPLRATVQELASNAGRGCGPTLLVNLVWTLLMLNEHSEALEILALVESRKHEEWDVDDRLVLLSVLSKIYDFLGMDDRRLAVTAQLTKAKVDHLDEMSRLRDALAETEAAIVSFEN